MQLETYNKLYRIAEAQAGYFTTAQAAAAGVDRKRLARYAVAGRLERIRRSIYRLVPFPRALHEDLFVAWLETGHDAVISHDSALALYELSDALPAAIHVTVPSTASRRHPGLRLHTNQISPQEITHYDALPVTTVARTIADVALVGLADELVQQAVQEAIQRGLVTPALLLAAAEPRGPRVRGIIRRALEWIGQLPNQELP
jgi:predicted transcriptional regulator of viral defense system